MGAMPLQEDCLRIEEQCEENKEDVGLNPTKLDTVKEERETTNTV